jgi:hypothetical protein
LDIFKEKQMSLNTKITLQDILACHPCYSPTKWAEQAWRGTIEDLFEAKQVPLQDRVWLILQLHKTDRKLLVDFANYCAKEAEKYPDDDAASAYAATRAADAATRADDDAASATHAYAAASAAASAAAHGAAAAAAAEKKAYAKFLKQLKKLVINSSID